jgi:hypothetical protein
LPVLYFYLREKICASEQDEGCNGTKDDKICSEAEMSHIDKGSAKPINAIGERVYHGYDYHGLRQVFEGKQGAGKEE